MCSVTHSELGRLCLISRTPSASGSPVGRLWSRVQTGAGVAEGELVFDPGCVALLQLDDGGGELWASEFSTTLALFSAVH